MLSTTNTKGTRVAYSPHEPGRNISSTPRLPTFRPSWTTTSMLGAQYRRTSSNVMLMTNDMTISLVP
jgi:hypothetical protein